MIKEIDKPEEPPRIAVKFANMVFVLGMAFSILLAVYARYKIYNPPEPVSPVFYIISMLSGGVFAALFGLGLKRLSNNLKVNLSVLFFTIGVVVYGFETYLEFGIKTKSEIIAKHVRQFGTGLYTAEGYKLVVEAIGKRLEKDGIISLGSEN